MQIKEMTNNTIYPSSYISGTNVTTSTTYPTSNFCQPVDGDDDYTRLTTTRNTSQTVIYGVDCSAIPINATIKSVSARVRCYVSNTTYITDATVSLYSNTTSKSSAADFHTTTTSNIVTLTGNNISRNDLNNLRIQFNSTRNNSSSYITCYLYLYGATITIVYEIPFYRCTLTIYNGECTCEYEPNDDTIPEGSDATYTINSNYPNILKRMFIDDSSITPTKIDEHWEYTKTNIQADFTMNIMCSITPVIKKSGADVTGISVYKKINGVGVEQNEQDGSTILYEKGRLIKGGKN